MTKTLADMTPEQRQQCVGMWCEYTPKTDAYLAIIAWVHDTGATIIWPDSDGFLAIDTNLTPRFDLPRAWNPDGTPPKGEWQTAKVKIIPNENAKYDRARGIITGDAVADPDHEPLDSHDIRRFVGEWEEI